MGIVDFFHRCTLIGLLLNYSLGWYNGMWTHTDKNKVLWPHWVGSHHVDKLDPSLSITRWPVVISQNFPKWLSVYFGWSSQVRNLTCSRGSPQALLTVFGIKPYTLPLSLGKVSWIYWRGATVGLSGEALNTG